MWPASPPLPTASVHYWCQEKIRESMAGVLDVVADVDVARPADKGEKYGSVVRGPGKRGAQN